MKMKKLCLWLPVLAVVSVLSLRTAAAQDSLDAVSAYQAWYAANTAGDVAKATDLAQAYLEKFPTGQYADYLGKWLTGARGTLFNEAIKKKDMAEMVRIGEIALKKDPKDLTYLFWMAFNLRQHELLASGEPAHVKELADYSKRAIDLIEADGKPTGIDPAKWDKNANLAWLQQNLALIAAKEGNKEEALKRYEASSALAPKDVAIQARNSLGCGSIQKDMYDDAAAKYQALPEAERSAESPSAAATGLIDQANAHADAAIECWARFVGVTTGSTTDLRPKMEVTLAALYKYRHPDDPDGYKALVAKYAPAP